MRYVLDASVALKWFLTEPDSVKAERLRDEWRQSLHDLTVPDVFPIEMCHSITRAERQARITPAEGAAHIVTILTQPLVLFPSVPLLPRAYAISSSARIGVYDCLYVALAEREGCEFVTADAKLVTNLQSQFPFIIPLAEVP